MLVQIITGTTREGRFSEKVADWITGELKNRTEFDIEPVDLRDHALPFFYGHAPLHTPRDYPRDDVARLGQTLDRADGFIVLTAEYNHGYPAVLKNAMDWTFVEWRRKPIAFVGWGQRRRRTGNRAATRSRGRVRNGTPATCSSHSSGRHASHAPRPRPSRPVTAASPRTEARPHDR